MATFNVSITHKSVFVITVEADGHEEAIEKAEQENPHDHRIISLDETEVSGVLQID